MALTIDTTIGGAASNSYVTIGEADSYFESRPNNTWASLADEVKKSLLLHAARMNDRLVTFRGVIVNTDPRQALRWPRRAVYDDEGERIAEDIIPAAIKDAQCEQAWYLSKNDPDATAKIKYLKADVGKGAVSTVFNPHYSVQKIAEPAITLLEILGVVKASAKDTSIGSMDVVRS